MSKKSSVGRAVLALAAVVGALTLVAWRQSTARETMRALEDVVRELALAADEHEELVRRLVATEGRSWVGAEAARRLGLRPPTEREVVIPSGGFR